MLTCYYSNWNLIMWRSQLRNQKQVITWNATKVSIIINISSKSNGIRPFFNPELGLGKSLMDSFTEETVCSPHWCPRSCRRGPPRSWVRSPWRCGGRSWPAPYRFSASPGAPPSCTASSGPPETPAAEPLQDEERRRKSNVNTQMGFDLVGISSFTWTVSTSLLHRNAIIIIIILIKRSFSAWDMCLYLLSY